MIGRDPAAHASNPGGLRPPPAPSLSRGGRASSPLPARATWLAPCPWQCEKVPRKLVEKPTLIGDFWWLPVILWVGARKPTLAQYLRMDTMDCARFHKIRSMRYRLPVWQAVSLVRRAMTGTAWRHAQFLSNKRARLWHGSCRDLALRFICGLWLRKGPTRVGKLRTSTHFRASGGFWPDGRPQTKRRPGILAH